MLGHRGRAGGAGIGGFADAVPDELAGDVHAIPVEYLGIWDTVEAWFAGLGSLDWPDTCSLWNVRRLRHAVSIDETRRSFRYLPVDRRDGFEEAWFPGVHCDVGGTFHDHDLATIALKWVFDGVCDQLQLARSPARRDLRALLHGGADVRPDRSPAPELMGLEPADPAAPAPPGRRRAARVGARAAGRGARLPAEAGPGGGSRSLDRPGMVDAAARRRHSRSGRNP
ncbi:phospholipase effector Tle1 domain-containing protein [Microbacterium elymi]|uniref:DUF2235 domain-containing protein n=1 Tax=Microbacterium elymi TaxID=2909587 RepID=A0ABY5NLH8_9MICO|nr:DUF2235 domain-containing protein [Microbacterium elymi]UUT36015.1 DUF2235 domain-containing protein [Microbacterium elymi]